MVSYRGDISIVSLIVYVPALPLAFFLTLRHGFSRTAGWIFLFLFDLIRIIGVCLQLATESAANAHNTGLFTGAAILTSVGLSPLFLTTVGLLLRRQASLAHPLHSKYDRIMHYALIALYLPIMVALILGIVGGVDSSNSIDATGHFIPNSVFKAAVAVFVVSFALIVLCTAIITAMAIGSKGGETAHPGERYLGIAVVASLPFLLVRLVYGCFVAFSSNKKFQLIGGEETVTLTMQVLMEFAVVIVYTLAGFMVKKIEPVVVEKTPRSEAGTDVSAEEDARTQTRTPAKHTKVLNVLRWVPIVHWVIPKQ